MPKRPERNDVLVIIDIQNDYFPGGAMELVGADAAGQVAAATLARYRAAGLPVVHVRHESVRPVSTFFLPGTKGADIHPCVAPLPGEPVVLKHYPSSFRDTNLLELLRALSAARLTVCGMMTHMCVDTTVRAAFDLGFAVRLAADACATRDLSFAGRTAAAADVQTAYLAALGAVFAQVAPAAELELP
ncbi:MAG: cysteine hydrolase family protein [Humidesulfovibrio sp.]|uniref:cysteine hydrolase family protein n=1 Tax=Humidesulfovibrio sp. TaxID=2910988 RepID=UPI0027E65F19|nr:cysteine hydrolase family protein [Humidesulfovibrio sp.]MDQ7835284.1 cysteine hydrolase family protein [Humidesulfovibrio sp.]